ncbi:MAG TPA: tetratricopeptide repeat protein [Pyrinomonadaceae bacterium]|nr:tetratricopeptide repeat protein [Pyrinomonadaceae bacterium]
MDILDPILKATKDYWFLITLVASVVLTLAYMIIFRINPWDQQRAVKLRRDRVKFHNAIGYSLIESGRFTEALSEFEESLKLSAEDETALNGRYISNLFLSFDAPVSDPAVGIAIQQHLSKTDALKRECHLHVIEKYLGDLHDRIGNRPRAEEHYEAALKQKPDYPHALYSVGWLRYADGRSRVGEMEQLFRKLTEVSPYDFRGYHGLGYALYMKATGDGLDAQTRKTLMTEATDHAGRARDLIYNQLNVVMDFGEVARSTDPWLSLHFHKFAKKIVTDPELRDSGENRFPIWAKLLMSDDSLGIEGKDAKLSWINYQRALDYLAMERMNLDPGDGGDHKTFFDRARRLDTENQILKIYNDQLEVLNLLLPETGSGQKY